VMDVVKVLSKLKKAVSAVEEVREYLESIVVDHDERKRALVRALIRADDALRLLDDALVEVELEYFEKASKAREVVMA